MQSPLPVDFKFASQTIPVNTRLTPAPFWQYIGEGGVTGGTVKETLNIAAGKENQGNGASC